METSIGGAYPQSAVEICTAFINAFLLATAEIDTHHDLDLESIPVVLSLDSRRKMENWRTVRLCLVLGVASEGDPRDFSALEFLQSQGLGNSPPFSPPCSDAFFLYAACRKSCDHNHWL